jgi:hypothetical protein
VTLTIITIGAGVAIIIHTSEVISSTNIEVRVLSSHIRLLALSHTRGLLLHLVHHLWVVHLHIRVHLLHAHSLLGHLLLLLLVHVRLLLHLLGHHLRGLIHLLTHVALSLARWRLLLADVGLGTLSLLLLGLSPCCILSLSLFLFNVLGNAGFNILLELSALP